MKLSCPKCGRNIETNNINLQTDVAQCIICYEVFKISESFNTPAASNFSISSPPKGAWYDKEFDKVTVGASTRSPIAFFIVPFMIVWSGGSLGGIYGTQIASGEFSFFTSLFGLPFLIGTLIFGSLAVMSVAGKVEVVIENSVAKIFVGVGGLGWTRTFDWNKVQIIREENTAARYPGGFNSGIVLEGEARIKFGTNLNENRRYFILNVLKQQKRR